MPCNVDCLSTYGCGQLLSPQEGAVYAPFVELSFRNQILTVGNSSTPPDNHAVIKSFEYGFSVGTGGLGFKIEVLDQGGITYRRLIDAINKTTALALDDTKNCSVRFGWIVTDCSGVTSLITNEDFGSRIYFMPSNMQTQFENGLIKFTFEGTSMVPRWAEIRLTKTLGSQDNKMGLKQALTQLFTEYDPKVSAVYFKNKDGEELCFASSDGGCDGPKGVWPMDQQNALAIARKWLSGITTKDKLGILILYDPTGPDVIFQEDPNSAGCCTNSIGTFIVNGGNCSNVLSFQADMIWQKGMNAGGGGATGGAASGKSDALIKPIKDIEKAGTQTGPTVQQSEWMWRNPDEMIVKNADAIAAHLEANSRYEALPGIQAELKILGRPDFADTIEMVAKTAAIVVINPFYISQQNCSWITTSNCNRVLSNKKWQVNAVSHQINSGSYITTLKLMLSTPNVDTNASDPLGGAGCGTETFSNSVSTQPNGT